jgi:hypothetical protein
MFLLRAKFTNSEQNWNPATLKEDENEITGE